MKLPLSQKPCVMSWKMFILSLVIVTIIMIALAKIVGVT